MRTMADVIRANRKAGKYFFSPGTMRFFNSRIKSKLIRDKYFITSEYMDITCPVKYTIREALADGRIKTVSKFQEYDDLEDAILAIGALE